MEHNHPKFPTILVPDEWIAQWQQCPVCHDDLDAYLEDN